jgi:AraC-like DNA-binding protein
MAISRHLPASCLTICRGNSTHPDSDLRHNRHNIERAVQSEACIPFRQLKKLKKLELARELLMTNLPVKQVAATLNYRSHSAFSRFFGAATGSVPRLLKSKP